MFGWLKRLFVEETEKAVPRRAPPLQITFPPGRAPTDDGIRFPCLVGETKISCEITFEALQDCFDSTASGDEFIDLFDHHRQQIIVAAEKKIRRARQNGNVVRIDTADVR
jgi:hypothetical protein